MTGSRAGLTLLAAIAVGCSSQPTPVTGARYENRAWSVTIPGDLSLSAPADPGYTWASHLVQFVGPEPDDPFLLLDSEPSSCTGPSALHAAQAILTRVASPGSSPTAESKHLGGNDVAIGSVVSGKKQLTAVSGVICGRDRVLLVTANGLTQPDVERILSTLVLRDPVSTDPNPPSALPS